MTRLSERERDNPRFIQLLISHFENPFLHKERLDKKSLDLNTHDVKKLMQIIIKKCLTRRYWI